MAEYIERDCMTQEDAENMDNEQAKAILIPLRNMMLDQHGCPISDAYFAIDKAIKALDVQLVHGHWMRYNVNSQPDEKDTMYWKCSKCYNVQIGRMEEPYRYCPYCGARMDEDG